MSLSNGVAKTLRGNSKGQTLIEVLIALALLSVMYSIHGQAST